jgi:hypothetical protein
MSEELHPAVFKTWHITERGIFFATAICPVHTIININNMVKKSNENLSIIVSAGIICECSPRD